MSDRFGAVSHLEAALQQVDEREHRHLMVAASGVNFIDLAGTRLLAQEARRRRALRGGLYFLALKDEPMSASRRHGALVLSRLARATPRASDH